MPSFAPFAFVLLPSASICHGLTCNALQRPGAGQVAHQRRGGRPTQAGRPRHVDMWKVMSCGKMCGGDLVPCHKRQRSLDFLEHDFVRMCMSESAMSLRMASEGPGKEPRAPATVSASVRDFLRRQHPSAASYPTKNRTAKHLLGPPTPQAPAAPPAGPARVFLLCPATRPWTTTRSHSLL